MVLERIKGNFSVCKAKKETEIDLSREFCFVGKTDEEISLVCRTEEVPGNTTEREDGWRAFRIQGVLDFSMVGVLSRLSAILAEEKIGIFVVSTYNTDYVFVKEQDYERALLRLAERGYTIQ